MLHCPTCAEPLKPLRYGPSAVWGCAVCEGRAATFPLLRDAIPRARWKALQRAVVRSDLASPRLCPSCRNPMRAVREGALEFEACTHCQLLWFDRAELPEPEPKPGDRLSPEAAEALVRFTMEEMRKRDGDEDAPDGWRAACEQAGLPYEVDAQPLAVRPFVTATLAILLLAVGGFSITHPGSIARFTLLPSALFRHGASALVTHFFVHDGILLLFGNMYFLLTAGDDVEEVVGHAGLLVLVLLGAAGGALFHALLSSQPLLGAGDGISALLAYYSLRFPRARIGWMGFNMPAFAFLLTWVGVQISFSWVTPVTISPAAQFGGAAVGVAFWALQRRMSAWSSTDAPPS